MTTAKNYTSSNLFLLPNNQEGRDCLETLRKYTNRKLVKVIRARGRGSRTAPALANGRNPRAYDQSLPLEYSERLAIYIDYHNHHLNSQDVARELSLLKMQMRRDAKYVEVGKKIAELEYLVSRIED